MIHGNTGNAIGTRSGPALAIGRTERHGRFWNRNPILGRRGGSLEPLRRHLWLGLPFGVLPAAGQGVGLVLAERALTDFGALSGTLLRMTAAMLVLVAVGAVQAATSREGRARLTRGLRDAPAPGFTAVGVFLLFQRAVWRRGARSHH